MRSLFLIAMVTFVNSISNAVELSKERVIFHTNLGDIVVAYYPKVAPKHVEQMLNMVKAGVYTDTTIYRIEKGFVAQVENFDARAVELTDVQKSTVHKLQLEVSSEVIHHRGLLSMARFDDPNSAESSFSFMLGDAPHLDNQYTVFGELVAGFDVLGAIENVPVEKESTPLGDVIIKSAEVVSLDELKTRKLQMAQVFELPGEKGRAIFKIFAALAFSFTVALPVVRSLLSKSS